MTARSTFGPQFFGITGRSSVKTGAAFGCDCAICGREISAPMNMQGATVWCLYCGMERGHVPMVEIPLGIEFSFGITKAECEMITAWCKNGDDLDAKLIERAETLGQVWDLF